MSGITPRRGAAVVQRTAMTKGIGSSIRGYTIESLLGRGGMSTVYIAEDAKLGRKVALKIMSEERSENEAFRSR
jgi:serine/threonine protein kinase